MKKIVYPQGKQRGAQHGHKTDSRDRRACCSCSISWALLPGFGDQDAGLLVIDVTDPGAPIEVGNIPGHIFQVTVV
jgi:hypothetical protein